MSSSSRLTPSLTINGNPSSSSKPATWSTMAGREMSVCFHFLLASSKRFLIVVTPLAEDNIKGTTWCGFNLDFSRSIKIPQPRRIQRSRQPSGDIFQLHNNGDTPWENHEKGLATILGPKLWRVSPYNGNLTIG